MVRPGRPPFPEPLPAPAPLAEVAPGPVPIPTPVPEPRADSVPVPPLPEPFSAPTPVPTPPPPAAGPPLPLPAPTAVSPAALPTTAPVLPIAAAVAVPSIFDPGAVSGARFTLGETANRPRASPKGICGSCCGKVGVGLSDTSACSSVPGVCSSLGGSTAFSPAARRGFSAAGRIGAGGGVAGNAIFGGSAGG